VARLTDDQWRERVERACVEEGDGLYRWPDRKEEYFALFAVAVYVVFMVFAYKGDWHLLLRDYWWLFLVALGYAIYRYRFGPLGEPLARMDTPTQTLTLLAPGNIWPRHIKVPLSTLRSLTIEPSTASRYAVTLEFVDRHKKTIVPFSYSRPVRERVTDFLQRKLPPSVKITVDNEPPLFGRGGL